MRPESLYTGAVTAPWPVPLVLGGELQATAERSEVWTVVCDVAGGQSVGAIFYRRATSAAFRATDEPQCARSIAALRGSVVCAVREL